MNEFVNGLPIDRMKWEDLDGPSQLMFAVDLACELIGDIPSQLENPINETIRVALIECWFINCRLLIEFLELHGCERKSYDFGSRDLGWTPNPIEDEWKKLYDISSKWVAHLSLDREIKDWAGIDDFHISTNNLRDLSRNLLAEYSKFVDYLEAKQISNFRARRYALEKATNALN